MVSHQKRGQPVPLAEGHASLKWPMEVVIDPSARPLLTSKVQETLNRLLSVLQNEAVKNDMPLTRIEVSGFVDPEEDAQEVVVKQWIKVSPDEALNYWNRLGDSIEVWMDSLPQRLKSIAAERLAIEIWGDADESAA